MIDFTESALPGANAAVVIAMDLALKATIVLALAVRLIYGRHPLFWPVGRITRGVREQACDDLCVHGAGTAAAYRASVLEVASGLVRRPELGLGLALAHSSNLARRLAWIDVSRGDSRCLLSLRATLGMAMATAMVVCFVGSIQLERQVLSAERTICDDEAKALAQVAQPPAIEVDVVAKDTGMRLPGAKVNFSIDFAHFTRKADSDGVVRLDLTQRLSQDALSFDVWADGYVQQRYFFAQNDARYPKIPERVKVELLPGEETLGGKVTDERSQPIPGVDVRIWGYLGEKKDTHELAWRVNTTTDENGQWRCRCFRSMTFAYIYLSHPDYLSDGDSHPRKHGEPSARGKPARGSVPAIEQSLKSLRDFSDIQVMTKGIELAGRVTDEQDRAIAGAEVGWLERGQRGTFHQSTPLTSTNATGRFRFAHVRPGSLVMQVKASGHAPELKLLNEIDMAGHLTVKLGPPRSLAGRIVDSNGEPIRDVFVNIDTWRGYRSLGVFLMTDAEGRFLWFDAPHDPFFINVSRVGFASIQQREVLPDQNALALVLNRSLTITGRITDAATDEPINQTDVEVGVTDAKTGEVVWSKDQTMFSFQGRLQGNIDVEKRPELRLRVSAAGYEPAVSRVFRGDENQVEYDVKLKKTQ